MSLTTSELTQAMVDALKPAWQTIKGEPLPAGDTKDAEVMFRAVALGLLTYLSGKGDQFLKSITFTIPNVGDSTSVVKQVEFDTNLT